LKGSGDGVPCAKSRPIRNLGFTTNSHSVGARRAAVAPDGSGEVDVLVVVNALNNTVDSFFCNCTYMGLWWYKVCICSCFNLFLSFVIILMIMETHAHPNMEPTLQFLSSTHLNAHHAPERAHTWRFARGARGSSLGEETVMPELICHSSGDDSDSDDAPDERADDIDSDLTTTTRVRTIQGHGKGVVDGLGKPSGRAGPAGSEAQAAGLRQKRRRLIK
jgi:hypothetical protein